MIKNHFEVFLVTSKKQGNGIIEFTHICQLNVNCVQDSVSGIVLHIWVASSLRSYKSSSHQVVLQCI
jgi:aminopeptidase-like protein